MHSSCTVIDDSWARYAALHFSYFSKNTNEVLLKIYQWISENNKPILPFIDFRRRLEVEKKIKVQINSSIMLAGGKAVELDCPAKIIEGRTMVPIRAISESFKKKVFWDPKGLIVIGDNDKPFSSGDEYDGYLVDFLISYVDIGK